LHPSPPRAVRFSPREVRVVKIVLLGAVLLAASTGSASADPISITATRNIHGDALVDPPIVVERFEQIGTPFGSFTADSRADAAIGQRSATAIASQHTTIAADRWFGSGSTVALATHDIGSAVGESISAMQVNFSIGEPTAYLFRGTIGSLGDSNSELGLSDGRLFIWDNAFGLSGDRFSTFRTAQADHSGVLQPGAYEFFAFAQSTAGIDADFKTAGRATFDFDFRLGASPTPEPASVLLVGAGLLAFVYRRSFNGARAFLPVSGDGTEDVKL
jgi:hypothetical protein